MENSKQYCPLCGKEKPQFFIEYINKYVYIKCECEKQKEAEENERKRIKAIEAYINQRTKSSHIQLKDVKADLSTLKVDKNNKFAIEAAQYMAHIHCLPIDTMGYNRDLIRYKAIYRGNSSRSILSSAVFPADVHREEARPKGNSP